MWKMLTWNWAWVCTVLQRIFLHLPGEEFEKQQTLLTTELLVQVMGPVFSEIGPWQPFNPQISSLRGDQVQRFASDTASELLILCLTLRKHESINKGCRLSVRLLETFWLLKCCAVWDHKCCNMLQCCNTAQNLSQQNFLSFCFPWLITVWRSNAPWVELSNPLDIFGFCFAVWYTLILFCVHFTFLAQ